MKNIAKQQRKIAKALTKVQTVIGRKHKACCVKTVCLNVYSKSGLENFSLEINHNLDSTEQMMKVMAIAMFEECEKQGQMDLLNKVWKQVMSEHREQEQGTTILQ